MLQRGAVNCLQHGTQPKRSNPAKLEDFNCNRHPYRKLGGALTHGCEHAVDKDEHNEEV